MPSNSNAKSSAGKTKSDTALGGGTLGVVDEEQVLADVPQQQQGASVQFAPPQDITGEKISFSADKNSTQGISVDGIVEYSNAPADTVEATHMNKRSESNKRQSRRQSSLDLRKSIPEGLLLHDNQNAIMDDMRGSTSVRKALRGGMLSTNVTGCFHRVFLNPSYPLRRQMLFSFGSVSSLTILLVMVVSIIASIFTGSAIKKESNINVEQWVDDFMSSTSRYVSEALSPKIMPIDLVDLMVEIARDRFSGYPNTEDDSLTPFFDTLNQTNIYPLKNNPLPLDWDFRHTPNDMGNVNTNNYDEHVQDRLSWYKANPRLSTESAMYNMQGACNPGAKSSELGYHHNCSEANNDVTTGGIVAPNPTNEQVYRKAADLSPFLKALYEYHQDMKSLAYYFSNSGAGSTVLFPHYEFDSSRSYESIGCEWMREINPVFPELGPIGTGEEIARCHPNGTIVPTREYNPLERAWCRDQALDPSRVHNVGPYIDAWGADKEWLMTAGRAIYDHVTGAFIGCISADFTIDGINSILEEVKVDDLGIITLVRNDDDGTVVTSPNFDFGTSNGTTKVNDPILKTGVDQEMFDAIKSLVDFSQTWDPAEASRKFETTLFDSEENIISVYPIPPVPKVYDSTYVPEFFAIFSLPKAKGLAPIIANVSQKVDESVKSIVLFTVLIGVIGLVVVILLILGTASWFVEPLKWMHKVGDQVVGKFGAELDGGIDYERKNVKACSPKTELSSLVEEFSKMVSRFSGEGTAKRMRMNDTEKVNLFDYSVEFSSLYRSRKSDGFEFNYPNASEVQSLEQCHLGPNTRSSSKTASASSEAETTTYDGEAYKSPLFHWMVGLIVTPILVTTIVISVVVLSRISYTLPNVIVPVREEYLALRESYRSIATGMLAIKASAVTERAARDTHLLTRLASWLYFGGMGMSRSFTEVIEGTEECKTAPNASACEWGKDLPCDCAWNDFSVRGKDACTKYPLGKSRSLQKLLFHAERHDRYNARYPDVAHSPNTTAWWDNITVLPHSTDDESANTRYGTTYDRVQIVSALSTVLIPLYNYDKSNDKPFGMYIGFEADGMLAGYTGCNYEDWTSGSFWRSTEDNGAAKLRPELCPLGKYGYDPRCRGWYHNGRSKANAGNGTLHITPPYVFSDGDVVGQSITSPLIDQQGKKHVGQVIVDFLPDSIFRALNSDNTKLAEGGFSIMVTPESDILGHDTVIGPGFSLNDGGTAIEDLLLPDDAFGPILQEMKAGERGSGVFSRIGPSGSEEEIYIAYAPVVVKNLYPLNSSDIASGVKNETTLVYSLALAETEFGIINSFQNIDDFASRTVQICIGVLSALIAISTILIVYIAFRVTTSMTEPILQLLDVLRSMNCMRTSNDDIAKLSNYKGSCREVDNVYMTMEMLYKVVQFANVAFFSGDLEVAYRVLRDALRLFTRLDNKKAIAVASNNLGNTMLTIYRTMKANGDEELCGMSKKEVVDKGIAYFTQSLKLGEAAYDQFYDKQGWSEECLAFMQFLANRYFNRAIFLLTTSCEHENQKEAESMGFRDLQITADMDVEIVDQCVEMGFKINRVERYELMMSRVRGLLALVELGYSPDELFVEDQVTDVYQDLKNAMKSPSHVIFRNISVAGRMQKLDVELITYFREAKHDNINAARAAIRMLVEDEYIFPDAEQEAVKMLLVYLNTTNDENCPEDEDGRIKQELGSAIEALEHEYYNVQRARRRSSSDDLGGNAGIMRSLNLSVSLRNISERSMGEKVRRRSSAVKESVKGDFTMELF